MTQVSLESSTKKKILRKVAEGDNVDEGYYPFIKADIKFHHQLESLAKGRGNLPFLMKLNNFIKEPSKSQNQQTHPPHKIQQLFPTSEVEKVDEKLTGIQTSSPWNNSKLVSPIPAVAYRREQHCRNQRKKSSSSGKGMQGMWTNLKCGSSWWPYKK
jgi:hypothetical protein